MGSLRLVEGQVEVALVGELDLHSAPQLVALLSEAVVSSSVVVVDMGLVSFCDARGLGALVRASGEARASGGRLTIRAATHQVRRLFELTGLDGALDVEPATSQEQGLANDLAAAARLPLTRGVLDAALKLAVTMSQSVMAGADGVSITLPRDGRLRTVAASNDVVLQMDHDQYDTGEGPCLDAATLGGPFHSADLKTEHRWPHFVPRARARGIESIMSTPLMQVGVPLGALNVYSRAPHALAEHEQQWATEFAAQAASVLLAADPTVGRGMNQDIGQALLSREVIALAQGVVMARKQIPAEAAHRFLMGISLRTSTPLRNVCEQLLRTSARDRVVRTSPVDSTPGGDDGHPAA